MVWHRHLMSARLDLSLPVLIALAIAVTGASAAPAPPAAKASAAQKRSTTVSGVTVVASRTTPHVVATFPAHDAKVAPGLLVLRVTYDTRMRADGWSYASQAGVEYPDCGKAPRLLDDGKSFVVICRTLPMKRYAVWFNRPPLVDFASLSRRPADSYELTFATNDDDPIRTLPDAMKADPALAKGSNPVEPEGLGAYTPPQDAPGG